MRWTLWLWVTLLSLGEPALANSGDCSGGPCFSGIVKDVVVSGSVGGALAGGWAALAGKGAVQIAGYVLLGGIAGPVVFIATVIAVQELTLAPDHTVDVIGGRHVEEFFRTDAF